MQITKPKIVKKVWGREEIIDNNGTYCGKKLMLSKGYRSSIHRHLKLETFYIHDGRVYLELEDGNELKGAILNPRNIVCIQSGRWHRFSGLKDSVIFEFSTPDTESERKTQSEAIPDFENWRKKIERRL